MVLDRVVARRVVHRHAAPGQGLRSRDAGLVRSSADAVAGGRVHAEASRRLPAPATPRDGWCEQDARGWWPAVADTLSELTGRLREDRASVVTLSVRATSGTVVALDADGDPTAAALMHSDQRATAQAEVAQEAGRDRWQRLGPAHPAVVRAARWGWLMSEPEVAASTARLGHASDLVVSCLLGGPRPRWRRGVPAGRPARAVPVRITRCRGLLGGRGGRRDRPLPAAAGAGCGTSSGPPCSTCRW